MKLYYSDVLAPRKVCALAGYLGSPLEYIYLDLQQGEQKTPGYLALNPNGKVPTLVDGATVLWEADAILCHLALRAGSDLWPTEDSAKIEVIRWFSWAATHFTHPGGDLYFEYIIKPRFKIGPVDPTVVEAALATFRANAPVLNSHLETRTWLVGDRLSVADFSVAVTLAYAEQTAIPLAEFPAIERWNDRLNALEAWREPFPVRA